MSRAAPRAAPRVLVVAGLDPSGGAGLVADLEALRAAGARGWAVAAALTAQGPRGARGFEPVSEAMLLAQLDALLAGRERPRAVKTGMVGSAALARTLADRLRAAPLRRVPLVMDPVLASSSGAPLLETEGLRRARRCCRSSPARGSRRRTCPSSRPSPATTSRRTTPRSARRAGSRRAPCS
ncbi:MAG TPA: bifunctional hydroxymethylpyrimidine kinase/phosphomethylpyrimidine kinase [Anaeromyxobacter sp.]